VLPTHLRVGLIPFARTPRDFNWCWNCWVERPRPAISKSIDVGGYRRSTATPGDWDKRPAGDAGRLMIFWRKLGGRPGIHGDQAGSENTQPAVCLRPATRLDTGALAQQLPQRPPATKPTGPPKPLKDKTSLNLHPARYVTAVFAATGCTEHARSIHMNFQLRLAVVRGKIPVDYPLADKPNPPAILCVFSSATAVVGVGGPLGRRAPSLASSSATCHIFCRHRPEAEQFRAIMDNSNRECVTRARRGPLLHRGGPCAA